jgi:hypothetical protein
MTTTPNDNTATTWRDLADQLTDQQRAGLARLEAENVPAETLLGFARDHIEARLTDIALADVAIPAGASTDWAGWGKNLQGDGYSRSLLWRSYEGGMADLRLADSSISVDIDGRQQCDGSFTRHISLWGVDEGGALTSDQARAVAALLTHAADELERLDTGARR